MTTAELRVAAVGALAQRLSPRYLEEHCLVPVAISDAGALVVAAAAPPDPTVLDELAWLYERPVTIVDAPAEDIQAAVMSAQSESAAEVKASDSLIVLSDEEEHIR